MYNRISFSIDRNFEAPLAFEFVRQITIRLISDDDEQQAQDFMVQPYSCCYCKLLMKLKQPHSCCYCKLLMKQFCLAHCCKNDVLGVDGNTTCLELKRDHYVCFPYTTCLLSSFRADKNSPSAGLLAFCIAWPNSKP